MPSDQARVPRLSLEFIKLRDLCQQKEISLRTLIESTTTRSHAVMTLIFALPFLLPIPLPGLSFALGSVIILSGGAMALNKKFWLPTWCMDKKISGLLLGKVFEYGIKMSSALERTVKPRGVVVLRHPWIRQINGFIIALCGFLLALPLPPGTNFPPAIAILLLSIGSLEEDILFMGLGYCAFVLNLLLFGGLWVFGVNGIKILLERF